MKSVNIGGVPEHFNFPWIKGVNNNMFPCKVNWHNCHGGTGEMTQYLREKKLDIAILLTEGIIKDIIDGNPSKIVHTYVESPLRWGVHVPFESNYKNVSELKGKTIAISRYKSGSHLMSYVMASNLGWDSSELNFEVVKNLDGGLNALETQSSEIFLWEKYTTNPYVIKKQVKRIGEVPTPWPCFSIAVRNEFLKENSSLVKEIIETVILQIRELEGSNNTIDQITNAYQLQKKDVENWYKELEWNKKISIDTQSLQKAQKILNHLGIIKEIMDIENLIYRLN